MPTFQSTFRIFYCLVFCLLLICSAASLAQAQGSISGSVIRTTDSAPIGSVTVNAYDNNWNYVASAITDSSGFYTIEPLLPGSYYLHTSNNLGYVDKFYNMGAGSTQRGSASSVFVPGSVAIWNINFSLQPGAGSIAGSVAHTSDIAPIENITVIAFQGGDSSFPTGGTYVAWAITDEEGDYSIPGLGPGSYFVKTSNTLGYADEYFDNFTYPTGLTPVQVTSSTTRGSIDFLLDVGGTISGRVTSDLDGEGIAGISIGYARTFDFLDPMVNRFVYTDSSGYFHINGLPAGFYHVQTSNAGDFGYANEAYDDTILVGPTWIPVAIETVTPGINISLAPCGYILGHVTSDFSGSPVASPSVAAYSKDWLFTGISVSNSSGAYSISGLPSGYYYLQVSAANYVSEYSGNASSRGTAIPVSITGEGITNVDFSMEPAAAPGSISGSVNGLPLFSLFRVVAYDTNWTSKSTVFLFTTQSPAQYTISNLPPGDYYVATLNSAGYADKYYNDAVFRSAAVAVTVTSGNTTAGIDFDLETAGSVSGSVTATGGLPIPNATIRVYDTEWTQVKNQTTLANGSYSITGLPPGDYYIATFGNKGYFDKYYNNSASQTGALPVTIAKDSNTPGVNFVLDPGYAVSGSISSLLDSKLIKGIRIDVYDTGWQLVTSAYSDGNGVYSAEGLDAGTYYLKTTGNARFIDTYFFNARTKGEAISISVPDNPLSEPTIGSFLLRSVIPPSANYDGDMKSDITVWRPDSGTWYSLKSGSPGTYIETQWGVADDLPVTGDYDGDGTADISVWRPGSGTWYLRSSISPGSYDAVQWGTSTDIPVPGDYDGDGTFDIAIWRPENGIWYFLRSSVPGAYSTTQWGLAGDIPVPNDYDGDGKTDIAIWRPASGTWYILPSESPGSYLATQWGLPTDKPVPGDYDRDGRTDVAVWRPESGIWYIFTSGTPGDYLATKWGMAGDIPTPGDYDGDGKMDISVWRPATSIWYSLPSSDPGNFTTIQWGTAGDLPISAATGTMRSLP